MDKDGKNEGSFGNIDNPMTQAFLEANSIEKILELQETGVEQIQPVLEKIVNGLYNKDTPLGTKLDGDALLTEQGFAEVNGNNPNLMHLTALHLAADALKNADTTLIGDSGLSQQQLNEGGNLMDNIFKEIVKSSMFITDKYDQARFADNCNKTTEYYREKNLLHKSRDEVKASISK